MKFWIVVAAADHVRFGRSAGFMQVSHGAAPPLQRIGPGDCIAYYSPTASFGRRDRLQVFTAIGIVKPGAPYQVDLGNGFHPYRRDVRWLNSDETPVRPLLGRMSFTRGKANWGHRLRYGLLEVGASDMAAIAAAMGAKLPGSTPEHQRGANSFLRRSAAKSTNARTRALARRPAMWTTWMGSGGSS